METAGKLVDNDELRYALKENGIGRPSTRAAIIETLFKRNYIRKEKKNLIATPTGVELIQLIHEELLKSAELTGIWEKKLREIERRSYDARQFIDELKQMVQEVVNSVLSDNSNRRITVAEPSVLQKALDADKKEAAAAKKRTRKPAAEGEEKKPRKKREPKSVAAEPRKLEIVEGRACPVCGKGIIIKGKAAFGCSEWRNGCTFRHPFEVENKQ
jgi:DNA topoisomerase-3